MKLCNLIMIVSMNIVLFGSCSEAPINVDDNENLLGIWKIESQQYLNITKNDTLENTIEEDGRYFKLNNNSELVIYWQYPNSSSVSLWKEVGLDSLYLFFGGPTSNIVSKYKYKKINDSKMIWEETINASEDFSKKFKFEVVKK